MIYVTGDTHGLNDFQKLEIYFKEHPAKKDDVLLILGDCAVLWNERDNYTEEYSSLGLTVLFIDGNHENFEMLNALPIVEIFGAKAHKVSPNPPQSTNTLGETESVGGKKKTSPKKI